MLFRAEIILKSQIKKLNDELNVGRLKLEVQKNTSYSGSEEEAFQEQETIQNVHNISDHKKQ